MDKIYQQRSQSEIFNGNGLMVLFNWGWSHLINKLSLIRSLNLFASETRISKWSVTFSDNQVDGQILLILLTLLRCFPVKLEISKCLAALVKKVVVCFTIISNLAVTTHISVNNVRADLFLKGIFIMEQRIQLAWWLENNFKFTKLKELWV